MCILNAEGAFVAINPAWEATLGWSPDEIVGQPYLSFLHADDVARSIAAFEIVKTGQPVLRFENRYRTKDGDFRWFSWVAVPEGDHFYCTIRDVTEDKRRDQTMSDQREEADLREQFLAVLGHDLRNPLSSLMAGLRLMSREPQSEKAASLLPSMQASCVRMSELITNMMDFARVRLGDGIGLQKAIDPNLADRMRQVVGEVQDVFPDAQIKFESDLGGPVNCDGPRIMQVLSNLLGNAVTHGAPDKPIEVRALHVNDRLKLSVSNQGEKISQAARGNLFQPFFKGDPEASLQGLGLGLYISSQIAEAHGGELKVTSDESETCFELDIPCK